jgi:hypothetical protein
MLALLNSPAEMREFTRRYVESALELDLAAAVAPFGLRVERIGARTSISADGKLTRQQRDLWRAFGYNENAQRAVRRVSS